MMTNAQIAACFDELADILEFQDANPFRVRAYRNAARSVRNLTEPLAEIIDDPDRSLTDLPGIGKDLADKLTSLVRTGRLEQLEELRAQVAPSVLQLLRIPSLGPKKAATLHRELGIQSLDQLREACMAHRVRELKGFGERTEQVILEGIASAESFSQRLLWAEADAIASAIAAHMKQCPAVGKLEWAGSYRRGRETVGDLDLLVTSADPSAVMDHFGRFPDVQQVIGRGDTKMSVRLGGGFQVDLRVVPVESFGAALQYFTGSKEHNVVLRGRAKQQKLKINEYGVFRVREGKEKRIAGATEEEVYGALDLPVFPPELREGRFEFDWAEQGPLPELIERKDLRGDLHMHTDESDGQATLEQMAEAARQRGLKYIAITDHSRRVSMARGLDPKRLLAQWKKIDALQQKLGSTLRVLKGVECDILEAGGMDLPDDVLAQADWVIGSIHYGQKQSRQQITERILGAIENPYVHAIAHPTGRLINRREAYQVDLDAVFDAASRHHKLLELNANPRRLDLDDVFCAAAREHGILIVINSDAHSTEGLDVLRYGILQARRAGLRPQDVANTRTWNQLAKLLKRAARD